MTFKAVFEAKEAKQDIDLEPTNVEKLRGLPWSLGMQAAVSVFAQLTFFGSGFVLFLDVLGLNKTEIGFVQSIVPFTGLIAIFAGPFIARNGYKRSFLTFWLLRYIIALGLLLIPWLLLIFGHQVVLIFLTAIMLAFSISRALAITALLTWQQEFIPDSIRGKYFATNYILNSITGFSAVIAGGYLLGRSPDINTFMKLFSIGIFFGCVSWWAGTRIPGGLPRRSESLKRVFSKATLMPLKDSTYLNFIIGVGLVTLGFGPLGSFLPLFLRDKVGLDAGQVVLLQGGTLLGGVLSSYIWGWAADRYGSRPVMLLGIGLMVTIPIFWFIIPRNASVSLYVAMAISFFHGLASVGWTIGSSRMLYVRMVPRESRSEYMAILNAWTGIVGGISAVLGGRVLDLASGLSGQFGVFIIDSYTVIFAGCLVLIVLSILILQMVRADSRVSVREFVGMFLHGNPVLAMESLIRYSLARGERATIETTEMLGRTKSPLTVDELIDLLSDPRFNVRFEAIISIARRRPDERLINSLIQVLEGNEPALSVISAWALSRIGDQRALPSLRRGLNSPYRSVQAHCARSLGTLGDLMAIPTLIKRLDTEIDHGLQIAYASALGNLGAKEAAPRILVILEGSDNLNSREELSLALARIVGDESFYIRLVRQIRKDVGTTTSQALSLVGSRIAGLHPEPKQMEIYIEECANTLAFEDIDQGAILLSWIIRRLPFDKMEKTCVQILQDCAEHLEIFQSSRQEYLLLALHTLDACCLS